jgi:hypothetical protein
MQHTSVNAIAVRELVEAARRVENPALLSQLPDLQIDSADLVSAIEEGRRER